VVLSGEPEVLCRHLEYVEARRIFSLLCAQLPDHEFSIEREHVEGDPPDECWKNRILQIHSLGLPSQ
jgi:hypothetical protein